MPNWSVVLDLRAASSPVLDPLRCFLELVNVGLHADSLALLRHLAEHYGTPARGMLNWSTSMNLPMSNESARNMSLHCDMLQFLPLCIVLSQKFNMLNWSMSMNLPMSMSQPRT